MHTACCISDDHKGTPKRAGTQEQTEKVCVYGFNLERTRRPK